jgi:hypothetical protein
MAKYFPTYQTASDTFFAWRAAQHRLVKPAEPDVVRLLPHIGWLSAQGQAAELALYHREEGKSAAELHKALANRMVARVRSVRGAYFIVEKSMVPYAVAAGQQMLTRRWKALWEPAGVTEPKREYWRTAILQALGERELTPDALKAALPAELTAEVPAATAKKNGQATYLQWLLTEMEENGDVHIDGTVARFGARFPHLPPPYQIQRKEAVYKIVERFFLWSQAAAPEDLAWWLGISPRRAEEIMLSGDLPLSNLVLTGGNSRGLMIHSSLWESLRIHKADRETPVAFLGAKDPLFAHNPFLLRRIITDEKAAEALFYPDGMPRPFVVEHGKPVGTWARKDGKIVWQPVGRMTPPLRKRIESVAAKLETWMAEHAPAAE